MIYDRPNRDWAKYRQKSMEMTLERLRLEMIKASRMDESCRSFTEERFWTTALPQALYDTLVSFEPGATRIAAQAFLETEDAGTEGD
jgi:hypothetical protein